MLYSLSHSSPNLVIFTDKEPKNIIAQPIKIGCILTIICMELYYSIYQFDFIPWNMIIRIIDTTLNKGNLRDFAALFYE